PVSFETPRTEPSGLPGLHYEWNFDDGERSESASPQHTFKPAHGRGTHTYAVTVTASATGPKGPVSGKAEAQETVALSEPAHHPQRRQHDPPGKSDAPLPKGPTTGPTDAPSTGVLPSHVSQQPRHLAERSRPGSGSGAGRGNGHGSGSGTGTGSAP